MTDLNQWGTSRGETIFAVSIGLITLSLVVVVLRFISRLWIRKRISADDWLILLALGMAIGLSAALCVGTKHGLGTHLPLAEVTNNLRDLGAKRKARFAIVLLYNPTLMTTKISILVFYLNLFKSFKHLKLCAWITMVVVGVGGFVLTMLLLFQCHPISVAFSARFAPPLEAKCLNSITILYAAAPLNIITDLAILLMPMPALTSLHLPKKEKIVVIFLFAGGGFVAVVGVVRIYYLDHAVVSGNFDWDGSLSFLWSVIEVNVGIICSSIPMLKPLTAFFGFSFHETYRQQNYQSGHRDLTTSTSDPTQSVQSCSDTPNLYTAQTAPNISPVGAPIKQVWKVLLLVTLLFFFWGFAYGLLGVLKSKIQELYNISLPQALGLHGAYFAPYLLTPRFFSGIILKKYGFKATFIAGLLLYTTSALVFWPAGILGSFPGFVVAAIFGGFGVATLETAANPYVALVGPLGMGESRLNVAQGFQAVGTICASLLEYRPTFSKIQHGADKGFADINWVFLAIVFFMVSLAVVFYYFKLPELKDSEFPTLEMCETDDFWINKCSVGPVLAIASIFFYVGAQETVTVFWDSYLVSTGIRTSKPTLGWELLGTGLFAIGRFIGGIALLWLCPRVVLMGAVIGCTITSGLAITQTGRTGVTMMILNRLFQSGIFPTAFSMGLRGLGRHSKTVSVYLVMGISGGAVLPAIYYAVAKHHQYDFAMYVPTIYFALCLVFPLYCYLSHDQRFRFGLLIRGDTTDQLSHVPPMIKEVYRYAREGLSSTKYLDPDRCVAAVV